MMADVKRLFVVVIAVFACVGMWGCGDDVNFKWEGRSAPRVVSLVDDSLVLLYNCRSYSTCHEGSGPMGYGGCNGGCENYGLFLANYRKKQSIYWGDTSNLVVAFMSGFYRDSMVIFLKNDYSEFGFWKIGEQPKLTKKLKWSSPCSGYDGFNYTRFRPWANGNVLLIGAKGCEYAILDTATGNVNELLTEGNYTWLKDCEDVVYLDGMLAGLKKTNFGDEMVWLFIDGVLMDSLNLKKHDAYVGDYFEGAVKWNGSVAQVYLNSMNSKSHLFSNPQIYLKGVSINRKFDNQFPEIWMNISTFMDSSGKEVFYNAEDLYVIGGR